MAKAARPQGREASQAWVQQQICFAVRRATFITAATYAENANESRWCRKKMLDIPCALVHKRPQ